MLSRHELEWTRVPAAMLIAVLITVLIAAAPARAELAYVNGIAIELRSLAVRGEPRVAAEQMAERWRRRHPESAVMLVEAGGGVVVGRQRGPIHEAALFKRGVSAQQSQVTVSVTHLGLGARALPSPPFALPRGARLLSVVETAVGLGTSVEFVVVIDRPVSLAYAAVQSAAAAADWTIQAAEPLRAVRRGEALVVVVQPLRRGVSLVMQHRRNIGS